MSTDGSTEKPRRRVISIAEKLAHLEAYDQAIQTQQGGAYLRANGLYSSQIAQWRKQRDAGMFENKQPGETIDKPSKEQAEIARLKRQARLTVTPTQPVELLALTMHEMPQRGDRSRYLLPRQLDLGGVV